MDSGYATAVLLYIVCPDRKIFTPNYFSVLYYVYLCQIIGPAFQKLRKHSPLDPPLEVPCVFSPMRRNMATGPHYKPKYSTFV